MNPLLKSARAFCVLCIAGPLFSQTAPQITTTSPLPNATIGSPYNQTLKATGGFPPYTWSINADIGQPPPWLSLSPSGTLSGAPTGATGTYTFVVDLVDQQRQSTSMRFSLTVQPPPLVITSTSPLFSGTVNANYSYTLTASGGTPPYTWGLIGNLPAGLNLSPGGQITGTPAAPGTSRFTIVLNDSAKASVQAQFNLTIQASVLSITTTSPLPTGVVGMSYTASLAATGGVSPYTWTAPPASLPPGLMLASNGSLTGTPTTTGSFIFTVQAADNPPQGVASQTVTKTFSLRIVQPVSVTTPSPINATLGVDPKVVLTATGGVQPYSWYVASGSKLPPGFSLASDSSGFLIGAPTMLGTFNFTVQVTDSVGGTDTKPLVMIVQAGIAITTAASAPNAAVGMSYTLTFAATGGYPPLTWTLDSGKLPDGLALDPATGVLSGTPLAAGTFSFVIRATDSLKATITKSFSITVSPAGGRLLLSSSALTVSALDGGDTPAPQNLAVISTADQPLPFTVQIDGGAGIPKPSWLSAGLLQGSTPARIPVAVDQTGLAPGTYSGRILVNTMGAPQSIVTVTLTVSTAAQQLDVSPGYLRFAGPLSALAGVEQDLLVRNSGGGGPLVFQASLVDDVPWLLVSSTVDRTSPNSSAVVRVTVNAQGLAIGSQRGAIRIDSAAGTARIPVTLVVRDDGPVIGLDVSGLRFEARQGNGSSNVEKASVLNLGSGVVNWQAQILSGADWLTIAGDVSGQSTAATPGVLSFTAKPGAMAAAGYYALVQISDPNALNSPQYFTVVLEIKPADSSPLPQPDPEGLLFVAKAGGAPAPPQSVNLFASAAAPITFHATATSGAGWLTVTPASGATYTQAPARVSVTANPANLQPGIYMGEVTFALSTTQTESTNVTLVVLPAGATLSPSGKTRAAVPGCTPAKLALVQTGLVNSFAAPAGWPTSLAVRLVDDCGSPVPSGQVVATFSNGDPALTMKLTDPSAGTYSATWSPGRAADTVTMTAHASAPNLIAAVSNITGSVRANKAPVLATNGVLNSVNPVAGAPLAPGTIAQVSGSSLAPSPAQADSLPLQTALNGTQVLIGPLAAALVSVSDGLLTVQIPTDLQPDKEYPVIVATGSGLTLPDTITTAKATPGVMVNPDNSVTALHGADSSPVTADSPAAANETILLSLVGMGATDPPSATGAAASADIPATVVTPATVTIAGEPAPVAFAQLTPGAVGLYQIGVVVPGDLQAVNAPVVITQNGVAANKATLPIQ